MVGVALAACGSSQAPAQTVANTAAATPRTPLADAKDACAVAARVTGPGVDIGMDGFSAEGGMGQVVSSGDGSIAAIRGRLLGESGRVDVEIYYAGDKPVCSTVIHARYAPPPDDNSGYGDVEHVDTIRRFYLDGALVGTEVNDELVPADQDATWVEDEAQRHLDNARAELAKPRAVR